MILINPIKTITKYDCFLSLLQISTNTNDEQNKDTSC
jgi:hypothetical protein